MRDRYWETVPLGKMTHEEWEALCDGCGKCCLNKLEDEATGEVDLTRVACRLLDGATCRCMAYPTRRDYVPECISLDPEGIAANAYWLPVTCAYRRLHFGEGLPTWHPLLTGDPESVHAAGASVRGRTVPEFAVDEEDWDDHVIPEPVGPPDAL